ncbi:hypothetical protein GQ55_5G318200 [Panicum hallii var. hallii]|uniref:Uncharacterized protein n=1 Tax=Panicum hallii var. hallii TaxID=1504633 RepID=A0A2T7DLQ6_9POAL|nr:hypothetical protein GQ55_5G318200 [Panicum hallii var. hallii]
MTRGSCPAAPATIHPPVCPAGATSGSLGLVRPRVVLFGDSITEQSFRPGGWGAALADTYSRKADVVVRGYGGYNTRWALFLMHHIFPLDGIAPPLATTIFFGANDAPFWEELVSDSMSQFQSIKRISKTLLII